MSLQVRRAQNERAERYGHRTNHGAWSAAIEIPWNPHIDRNALNSTKKESSAVELYCSCYFRVALDVCRNDKVQQPDGHCYWSTLHVFLADFCVESLFFLEILYVHCFWHGLDRDTLG